MKRKTRRSFLAGGAGVLGGVGMGGGMGLRLPPVSAREVRSAGGRVRFTDDLEPVVRFLEETPRDEVIEQVVARIEKGMSYETLMASLFLAGIREVPGASLEGHRNVGGHLHAVLMVNSAHQASLASTGAARWLPMLWAVDGFKWAQERTMGNGESRRKWAMPRLEAERVPEGAAARREFVHALEGWDEDAVEPAAAGAARSLDKEEVFEILCRYAARDFRYIGHKVIHVANSWRTLEAIGWRNAEPVLRSLGRALTAYYQNQEDHPAKSDHAADRPWRRHLEMADGRREGWQAGRISDGATQATLDMVRSGDAEHASRYVSMSLHLEISPESVLNGIVCGVAEQLMRRPNFNTLHAVTTANAIHYLYRTTKDDETKWLLLMQAATLATMFRESMGGDAPPANDVRIDRLATVEFENEGDAAGEVFADAGRESARAAGKALAWLEEEEAGGALLDRARELTFWKGDDPHDYKYCAAVADEYAWLLPGWRERFLAASMFQLRGSSGADTRLARRIADAVPGAMRRSGGDGPSG